MTDDVALLLRRAGFGPTAAELSAARQSGYAATLERLVTPPGPDVGASSAPLPDIGPDPHANLPNPTRAQHERADRMRKAQAERIERWWLDRMAVADHQAREKLVFFWHGHWATSVDKVCSAQFMLTQHRTFRTARDVVDLAHRMVEDQALIYWLDGQHNKKDAPNENLARELFELFLLGIGRYTERDVKEAGRALTGWRVILEQETPVFDRQRHDPGTKTILGVTSRFTAHSLVDLLLNHPECPRFVASRLWFRYASSTEPVPERTRDRMVEAFPDPMRMLRALFTDEAFPATANGLVKQPVEWLVGAMRQLGLRMSGLSVEVATDLLWKMRVLGQLPFAPPSVGGWPAGTAWLTSAAAQSRITLAGRLADLVRPTRLTPEGLAQLLCLPGWTNRTYEVLRTVQDPRQLLVLGLNSPEYLVT
ncbi:DUF1800 domain-containing protein [Plantactinospora sp. B5E13]|uniref:DUF1800 domain-containing protein n=1 Tax=unclassified Plantactinospora TaxID=2631981 RepID=UPI00325C516A